MKKSMLILLIVSGLLASGGNLHADECMEGDCDNGFGAGFTDDSKIYEGEWKDGLPHGQGKLYLSRGKFIEGIWVKGELVDEKTDGAEEKGTDSKD